MLRWSRRIVQTLSLLTFFFLLVNTQYGGGDQIAYPVRFFLDIDPLIQIGTALASRAVPSTPLAAFALIMVTLVLGRVFCGWICPFGALNQLAGRWRRRPVVLQRAAHRYHAAQRVKYGVLAGGLAAAVFGLQWLGLLDPISLAIRSFALALGPLFELAIRAFFDLLYNTDSARIQQVSEPVYELLKRSVLSFKQPVFRQAGLFGFIVLAILAFNWIRPRLFCRFLCPLGALLGTVARFTPLRLRHTGECDHCGRCAIRCPGGAEPLEASAGKWRPAECFVCGNCTAACKKGLGFELKALAFWKKTTPVAAVNAGRRTLVTGALSGFVAAPLVRLPVVRKELSNPLLIRPPGALSERDFLARCVRCGECMKVCLTGGLQPAAWEAGLEGFWTPVLVPRVGYCEYNCTLCGQVCPTGAIARLPLQTKHTLCIGLASVDPGHCLPLASGIECLVCEEHCPTSPKAIRMVKLEIYMADGTRKVISRPVVDPKRCIGCGICEARCPTRVRPAIRVRSPRLS